MSKTTPTRDPLAVIGAPPKPSAFSQSLEVLDDSDFSENAPLGPDVRESPEHENLDGGASVAQAPLERTSSSFPSESRQMIDFPTVPKNGPAEFTKKNPELPGMPVDAARVFSEVVSEQASGRDADIEAAANRGRARELERLELDAVAWTTVVSRIASASGLPRSEVQSLFLELAAHLEECSLASPAALPTTILTLESVLSLLGAARNLAVSAPAVTGVSLPSLVSAFAHWTRFDGQPRNARPPVTTNLDTDEPDDPIPSSAPARSHKAKASGQSPKAETRGRPGLTEAQKRERENAAVMAKEQKRAAAELLKANALKVKDLQAQHRDHMRKLAIVSEGESREEKALAARIQKQVQDIERQLAALGKGVK